MKLTTQLFAFSFTLIISSYVSASTEDAIASAEKARQAAAEAGYEWRDTALMIKQANELAAKGNDQQAIQLAKQAEEEGKDALNQYHIELNRYSKNH